MAEGVFLTTIVFAVVEMSVKRIAWGAGLMTVAWVK